jgi:hypothetical protein
MPGIVTRHILSSGNGWSRRGIWAQPKKRYCAQLPCGAYTEALLRAKTEIPVCDRQDAFKESNAIVAQSGRDHLLVPHT